MSAVKYGAESLVRRRLVRASDKKEPLQVRIPTSVKRAFKSQAALRGIEPNALFVEMWEYYNRAKKNTGTETD